MNLEQELKLQAWLDGELPPAEAARLAQTAQDDPRARQLVAELTAVKTALAGNELERKVPDTREFYWSQIQRRIQREETRSVPVATSISALLARWRRLIAPMAGALAGAALLVVSIRQSVPVPAFVETTVTSSDFDALTYHDQSSGMTVVWLKYREQEPAPSEEAPDIFDVR